MDEITADEWAKYTGEGGGYYDYYEEPTRFAAPAVARAPEGGAGDTFGLRSAGKDKEEYDNDYDAPKISNSDFVVKKKAKRSVSFSHQPSSYNGYAGGGEDIIQREIIRDQPDLTSLFNEAGGSTGSHAPIEQRVENKRIVPYNVQHSAKLLLDAHTDGDIRLGYESLAAVQKMAACDNEYTEPDPSVLIWDTLSTGTCKIYVHEVVPISMLLLARYLELYYTVTIMEDVESKPRPFSAVYVEPYHGQRVEGAQPLGCAAAVKRRLEHEPQSTWRLVEIYMLRMGALPPEFVCDAEWLEAQTTAMGKVLTRQDLSAGQRAPLGGGPGTGRPPIEREDD